MRVLVCGGRDYTDWYRLIDVLDHYVNHGDVIITGMARGADTLAFDYAVMENIETEEYPAQWEIHGKKAGPIRNQQMLDEGKPDLVIAFPGGNGTADMVRRAKKAGVKVVTV